MRLHLEETYLYKFHLLSKGIDKLFDAELRKHADIGLSHFIILLAVRQHKTMRAKDIASYLDLSPAAISRQVEAARKLGLLEVKGLDTDKREQSIRLTREGDKRVRSGLRALESHVYSVFLGSNHQMDLMSHVDSLLVNMKGNNL